MIRVCGKKRDREFAICDLYQHSKEIPHQFVGQESEQAKLVFDALRVEQLLGPLYYD